VEAPSFAKAPETPAVSHSSQTSAYSSAGAASAAAPAREPEVPKAPEVPAASAVEIPPAVAAPAAPQSTGTIGAAPTFTFGGSAEPATGGVNKKIFIGVAAAVVITVAAYFGWASRSHNAGTTATPAATTQSAPVTSQTVQPSVTQSSAPPAAAPVETAAVSTPSNAGSGESETAPKEISKPAASVTKPSTNPTPAKNSAKAAKEEAPEEVDATPEAAPLMVKGGKTPERPKSAPADVSAPSMIGMATPASAPPPDLVPTTTSEFKPKLQTMSVSQGVSQGLLFKKVAPVYPSTAIRLRIEGTVELMATISKSGDITQVKVVSGDSQLSRAAVDAVKQWKYKPYLLNGEPVEIQTQVTIKFKLPN
jgi:periplasmic protein TonB